MIKVNNRALEIPSDELKIGFVGDNKVEIRQFEITEAALLDFDFKLDLQAGGYIGIVDLNKQVDSDRVVLTWTVLQEHLPTYGTLYIQLRAFSAGEEKWHSDRATLEIGRSINATTYFPSPLPSEFEEMEQRVTAMQSDITNRAAEVAENSETVAANVQTAIGKALESATNADTTVNKSQEVKAIADELGDVLNSEVERRNAEELRVQAEIDRIELINEYEEELNSIANTTDLLGDALNSCAIEYKNTELNCGYTGRGVVSDENSLIAAIANDARSGSEFTPFMYSLISKGSMTNRAASLRTFGLDLGFYPFTANFVTSDIASITRFRSVNGKPTNIMDWHYKRTNDSQKCIDATMFTKDDTLYVSFNLTNIDGFRAVMEWAPFTMGDTYTSDLSGGYEVINSQGVISFYDTRTELYVAMCCTNMNDYQVSEDKPQAIFGLDTTKIAVSHSKACCGLGSKNLPKRANVTMCFSIGNTKEYVLNNVITGINNFEAELKSTEDYWKTFYNDIVVIPKGNSNLKTKTYFAISQLSALSYKGYLCSGIPNWTKSWIRDTAWAIHAISKIKPSFAKQLLLWYQGTKIDTVNAHIIDKTNDSGNSTDNSAVWLGAVSEYYKCTGDVATLQLIQSQIDEAFKYVSDNFNAIDKHVLAHHAHDYWDDYVPEIDTGLVKYESMIDVLWLYASKQMLPVFTDLGDTIKAQQCSNIITALTQGLEDYRRSDGGLEYAIKNDGVLYSTVLAVPGNIFAAWLLGDESCRKWLKLKNIVNAVGGVGGAVEWATGFSNAVTGTDKKEGYWFPHLIIIAFLALKDGDYQPLKMVLDSFPFGGLPEYVTCLNDDGDKLMHYLGAWSFTWSYGTMLELAYELSK